MRRLPLLALTIVTNLVAAGYAQQADSGTQLQESEHDPVLVPIVVDAIGYNDSSNEQGHEFCNDCYQEFEDFSCGLGTSCRNHAPCTELLGDLMGIRPQLATCGLEVESSLTQFYQGVSSGGPDQSRR